MGVHQNVSCLCVSMCARVSLTHVCVHFTNTYVCVSLSLCPPDISGEKIDCMISQLEVWTHLLDYYTQDPIISLAPLAPILLQPDSKLSPIPYVLVDCVPKTTLSDREAHRILTAGTGESH